MNDSEKRIQQLKKDYHEMLVLNLKKDIEINQLKKDSQSFQTFSGIFSDTTIDSFKSIINSKSKDSFFILTAIKDLYRSDLEKLKKRTYSGRVNTKNSKEPISPEKKKILTDVFQVRVKREPDGESRMKNLGKHIKVSIENINKTNNK